MKLQKVIFPTLGVVLFSLVFTIGIVYKDKILTQTLQIIKLQRPNIIILSVSSMNPTLMKINNLDESITKNLTTFSNNSNLVGEVISSHPWLPVYFQLQNLQLRLTFNGYNSPSFSTTDYYFQQPSPTEIKTVNIGDTTDAEDIFNLRDRIIDLKNKIDTSLMTKKPFFINAYFRYLHYPLWDSVNFSNDELLAGLPKESQKLMKKILEGERLENKLPLYAFLFNNIEMTSDESRVNSRNISESKRAMLSLISEKELNNWKSSVGFVEDLQLLKDVYKLKLYNFDKMIQPVLDLWGSSQLKENTVVILDFDYSQSFMEHDRIFAPLEVYDEFIKGPLLIALPWTKEKLVIKNQISKKSVIKVINSLITGERKISKFNELLTSSDFNDHIVSRNCLKSKYSIRYKNKWKFIKDEKKAIHQLFDLEGDPGELINVLQENKDMATELENKLNKEKINLDIVQNIPREFRRCFLNWEWPYVL
ncbi:MAG: hypothetical protein H6625_05765 [Bdellovibrionaceae bacterium]|nr:hypothetical protein [Pseudobdellovibrionaceae bacterium]